MPVKEKIAPCDKCGCFMAISQINPIEKLGRITEVEAVYVCADARCDFKRKYLRKQDVGINQVQG